MKIFSISSYDMESRVLSVHFPVFSYVYSFFNFLPSTIQSIIDKNKLLSHLEEDVHFYHKIKNEQHFFWKTREKLYHFSSDEPIPPILLPAYFFPIQAYLNAKRRDHNLFNVSELIMSMETLPKDDAFVQSQASLKEIDETANETKEQLIKNISKILRRGEHIEELLKKSEKLSRSFFTFKTPAISHHRRSLSEKISGFFASLFCCGQRQRQRKSELQPLLPYRNRQHNNHWYRRW